DTGVTPDVLVAAGDDLSALPDDDGGSAAAVPEQMKPAQKEDDQLRKAIDVLKAKTAQKS
ncbi:MAG TPA: hypothetical protein VLT16_09850, partial [Candidatus Limnocylindrales bacterium]|nr:hypothetical protein [Candidatus Limnocylindrales bacterium]